MSSPFSTVTSELPRDRWGRPLITPPEGGEPVAYQRVTTFVGPLEDTFHLTLWKQRLTALGMARRRDLVLAASAISDHKDQYQKRTLNDIVKQAFDAAMGGAAATTGTALHTLAEMVDKGADVANIPDEFAADLTAYRDIMQGWTVGITEGFVVVDDLRIGGSFDKVMVWDGDEGSHHFPDGTPVPRGASFIGDLKTGSVDLGMGKIAMQLGCYANGKLYDHAIGTRSDLPPGISKRWGIVVHLPAGTGSARLLWVDIAAGWDIASTVVPHVHAWRKRKDLSHTFAAVQATPTAGPSLVEQVAQAGSRAALTAIYAMNADRWTPGLTAASKARLAELGE